MPSPVRSRPDQIVLAVLAQLQEVAELPPERCFCYQGDELPYDLQADQVCWVTVEDGTPDLPNEYGAGRVDTRESFTLTVTVRTRLGTDEPGHSTLWLTEASLGHLRLAHAVKDALYEFFPEDADGNTLVTEGLKPLRTSRSRPDRKDPTWGESRVSVKVTHEVALDQTLNTP